MVVCTCACADPCLKCTCGKKHYFAQRWVGVVLMTSVVSLCYCMRVCIHIAIVRMVVEPSAKKKESGSGCPIPKPIASWRKAKYGPHDWGEPEQGWIISSFYIGYVAVHFPAGHLSDMIGARWITSSGVLLSIVTTALMPAAADHINWIAVVILRVIQGFGQGVIFPVSCSFLSRWIPKHERATAGAITFSGTSLGPLWGMLVTGYLMAWADNWQIIFYFWSVLSFILYILLVFYLYSDPTSHPGITDKEKAYLAEHLAVQGKKKVPYGKILSDGAIWAIIFGHFGHNILILLVDGNMPKYMDNVLNYTVQDNAFVSSIPYIFMWITSIIFGWLADWGISKKNWDVGLQRKIYTTIACFIPSFCLVAVGYVECNDKLAVVFFALSLMFKGLFWPGLKVNIVDLSTQYGGVVMAFANGISSAAGVLAPQLCAHIAKDNTFPQWKIVFWIVFGIATFTNIVYFLFGSGKRRRWDYLPEDQKYFVGRVPIIEIWDGVNKDKIAVEAGRAADGPAAAEVKP